MKTDECITGIVIESYDRGENQMVITDSPDPGIGKHHFFFFFLPQHPVINFGDTILMNIQADKYWIHHGNSHLTYRIFPLVFPGTLLLELILDRIDN